VALINVFGDGDRIISDYNRKFYFFIVNLSQEVTILFLHVVAMLENIVAMLENIMIALGGKMTIMDTFFAGLGAV